MPPTAERIRENAAFIRRWAWAISLVFTIVGMALVVPWLTDPDTWSILIALVLGWLVIYIATRVAAWVVPKMIFPGEP